MRAVRWSGVAVVLSLIAYCVLVALAKADLFHQNWFVLVVMPQLVFAGSAVTCLLRAARVPGDRLAWAFISAGLACYSLGTVLWQLVYERRAEVPYPSPSDFLWLAIAPLSVIGMWLMLRSRLGNRLSALLDAVVAGLGVASVSALVVFPKITEGATHAETLAAVVTNFAYPVVDLALAAAAIGAMVALSAWRHPTWLLLVSGFVVFTVADTVYLFLLLDGSFVHGGWNDASYMMAAALIALAALRRSADEVTTPGNRNLEFLSPLLFGLLPIGVLITTSVHAAPLAVGLAVAALAALATRTALAMREVVALSDQRRLARTDSLTGLPNRRALYDLLSGISTGSVMIIDLDRFKEINDALGHQVGDELLRQVSARYVANVPPPGVVARLGGDEFAVLLPETPRDVAARAAAGLLEALERPFIVTDTLLHVGGSIGITALRPGAAVGRALAEADMAMYRAKKARTGFEVYDDAQDRDAWDRLAMVEALRLALDRGQLSLAFQPIVDARTRRPRSVEALVRWIDPERGFVPPDVFLPLAEHAGLMPLVTRNVLDLAFDEARELRQLGHEIAVSVNLSASDLIDGRLEHEIAQRLIVRDLPASAVKIEITESLLVHGGRATEFFLAVRELGMELLVDDFGTGYSSLAYLHDLPVSTLKIDRAFTNRLTTDPRTAIIVASTIDMAHRLGLNVVAEGVETEDELARLQTENCDLIQGYLISRPLPAADLHTWLSTAAEEQRPPETSAQPGRAQIPRQRSSAERHSPAS
ncbi:putative bifunctional diguanylate cyclase/phosphodiesterase [Kineosporia babensis]|uniref:Bifunctional diguanylate cyclase/phosphodiesterase n=1 Tax=Kineosporia babensis TaxID=499548 RepID=A0A9X1NJ49_9ACTN|nr:bifunctional diguanylate cyclase/phosphodiesterase [Kineosporia babensis]MCD5315045.1 bifunctional diguanylate cyclase/phosphodiesterase [Kineosporia babensis]